MVHSSTALRMNCGKLASATGIYMAHTHSDVVAASIICMFDGNHSETSSHGVGGQIPVLHYDTWSERMMISSIRGRSLHAPRKLVFVASVIADIHIDKIRGF